MDEPLKAGARSLEPAERTLVLLRNELYGGSWDELIADLQARQNRNPFVFKLNSRIEEDLERIAKLRALEEETGLDLQDLQGQDQADLREGADAEEGHP